LETAIHRAEEQGSELISEMRENEFTDQEIIDNIKMFYFAGTETTGSVITTILAHLAKRSDLVEMLRIELREQGMSRSADLNYEKLRKLPGLRAVMYEAGRLVPPLGLQVRTVTKTHDIAGERLPKGANIFVDLYHRGRDTNRYSDANGFHPERSFLLRFVGKDPKTKNDDFGMRPDRRDHWV